MIKLKHLVIDRKDPSINSPKKIKFLITDVYVHKDQIDMISEQHANSIEPSWWEKEAIDFLGDKLKLYCISTKSRNSIANLIFTEEELKELISD